MKNILILLTRTFQEFSSTRVGQYEFRTELVRFLTFKYFSEALAENQPEFSSRQKRIPQDTPQIRLLKVSGWEHRSRAPSAPKMTIEAAFFESDDRTKTVTLPKPWQNIIQIPGFEEVILTDGRIPAGDDEAGRANNSVDPYYDSPELRQYFSDLLRFSSLRAIAFISEDMKDPFSAPTEVQPKMYWTYRNELSVACVLTGPKVVGVFPEEYHCYVLSEEKYVIIPRKQLATLSEWEALMKNGPPWPGPTLADQNITDDEVKFVREFEVWLTSRESDK